VNNLKLYFSTIYKIIASGHHRRELRSAAIVPTRAGKKRGEQENGSDFACCIMDVFLR
jgi:hypothetical protein